MTTDGAELWPWLALAGLGLFHGIDPAMGWRVGLGLQRGNGAAVVQALPPIALGHAVDAIVAAVLGLARAAVDATLLRLAAALCLIGKAPGARLPAQRPRCRSGFSTWRCGPS